MFAEHGVFSVSNRQIYLRHSEPMELLREKAVQRCAGSTDLRDWLTCVVRAQRDHHQGKRFP